MTADKVAINEQLFEETHHRDVSSWIPEGWRQRVEPWFQVKWPAAE